MPYKFEDPIIDWDAYEADREKEDENFPCCDQCGDVIYEMKFEINDETLCEECVREVYGKWV